MSEAMQAEQTETMDIVEYAAADPVSVLTDEDKYSKFLAYVKDEISKHDLSIETDAGRQQIKSLAYKVTRTKTTIDEAGKKLNEEARAQINAVDAKRRKIREELDALAKDVRRPLTEWEEAEKAREEQVAGTFEKLRELAAVQAEETSDAIAGRISQVDAIEISEDVFRSRAEEAERLTDKTRNDLQALFERTKQHEADQAELARLRAEQEERERQEREAREREEAERLERERQEHAAAEAERKAKEAAEQAREEERRKAEAEKRRVEYYHAMIRHIEACGNGIIDGDPQPFGILFRELEEKIVIDDTWGEFEQDALAAKESALAKLRGAHKAQEQRREDEKRAANKRHRAAVMKTATAAIVSIGVEEAMAKKIMDAICKDEIPHVKVNF